MVRKCLGLLLCFGLSSFSYGQCGTGGGSCGTSGMSMQPMMMAAPVAGMGNMQILRGTRQQIVRFPVNRNVPSIANRNNPPRGANLAQIGPKKPTESVAKIDKSATKKVYDDSEIRKSLAQITVALGDIQKQGETYNDRFDGLTVQLDSVAGDFNNLANSVNGLSKRVQNLENRKQFDPSKMRFALREVR